MHLGNYARSGGLPGEGTVSHTVGCWADQQKPSGRARPLDNIKYQIRSDYSNKMQLIAEEKEQARKAASHPTVVRMKVTVSSKELSDPLYGGRRSSPTLKAVMRNSTGYFGAFSWAPLGQVTPNQHRGVTPQAVLVGSVSEPALRTKPIDDEDGDVETRSEAGLRTVATPTHFEALLPGVSPSGLHTASRFGAPDGSGYSLISRGSTTVDDRQPVPIL